MTNQSQLLKELKHSPRPPLSRHSRAVIPTHQNVRRTTFPICVTDGGKPQEVCQERRGSKQICESKRFLQWICREWDLERVGIRINRKFYTLHRNNNAQTLHTDDSEGNRKVRAMESTRSEVARCGSIINPVLIRELLPSPGVPHLSQYLHMQDEAPNVELVRKLSPSKCYLTQDRPLGTVAVLPLKCRDLETSKKKVPQEDDDHLEWSTLPL